MRGGRSFKKPPFPGGLSVFSKACRQRRFRIVGADNRTCTTGPLPLIGDTNATPAPRPCHQKNTEHYPTLFRVG